MKQVPKLAVYAPVPSKVTLPSATEGRRSAVPGIRPACTALSILIGAPVKVGTDVLANMKTSHVSTVQQLHPACSCHTEFYFSCFDFACALKPIAVTKHNAIKAYRGHGRWV
jgi:hypothetical protein